MAELRLHGVVKAADLTPPVTTDDAPQSFINKDTTVSFNAFDADSGVAATYYTVDGGAKQTGNSVALTEEGAHTIDYWSVDKAGNAEKAHTVTVQIDKTAPVTTATVIPSVPGSTYGWYTSDVQVALSAIDSMSGTAKTEYQVNGGDWNANTGSMPAFGDGVWTVNYRSTDLAGNVEQVQTVEFKVDKQAPVTQASIIPGAPNGSDGWHTSDVTVTLSVYDNLSGAAKTEYQVNGGDWNTYTGSMPAFGDGVWTVNYRSTDSAGNAEQVKTVSFKVDKTAPTLSASLDKTIIWPANHKMGTVNVTLNANDAGSGIESVILTSLTFNQPDTGLGDIEADIGTGDTSINLRAEKNRIYTITYTATDKAGNKKVVSVIVTVPHDLSE
jgi:hypothetical protein